MKFLLLLALVACSTPEKKATDQAASENSAGESDAQQVSPYTVKPCYCMKIFQPVCAGGQNYGNSCEAECNGHKSWTEGNCASKKK